MEEQILKPFYDYDVRKTYSKINELFGKVILFRESTDSYPYTSARLQEAKIINILNSDGYAINIVLNPPLIESKDKPTPEQISKIINSYDRKTAEERGRIQESSDPFLSIIGRSLKLNEKLKEIEKIPEWKFLEKRGKKKEAISGFVSENLPTIMEGFKPLKISKYEDMPPLSIGYGGPWSRRVSSKEMVDTMEAVLI